MAKQILIICCILPFLASAQWYSLNQPTGGNITALGVDHGRVFTDIGFGTDDKGDTWQNFGIGRESELYRYGQYLFYCNDYGLYKSSDNGLNWKKLPGGTNNCFAIKNDTLLWGIKNKLSFSIDSGLTWVNLLEYPSSTYIQQLAVSNGYLFACLRNVGASSNAFYERSSDNGQTWQSVGVGLCTNCSTDKIIVKGDTMYLGNYVGLSISMDNGATWYSRLSCQVGGICTEVSDMLIHDNYIYVASWSEGVLRASLNDFAWSKINNGLVYNKVRRLASIGDTIFAANHIGVFRTPANSIQWKNVSNGFVKTKVNATTVHGDKLFTAINDQGVHTANGLNDWTMTNLVAYSIQPQTLATVGNAVYADSPGNNQWKSTDGGQTWKKTGPNPNTNQLTFIGGKDSTLIFINNSAFTDYFGSISYDAGNSWSNIQTTSETGKISEIIVHTQGLIACGEKGVFISIDSAKTWAPLLPAFSYNSNIIKSFGNAIWVATKANGIFKFTYSSGNWSSVSTTLYNSQIIEVLPFDNDSTLIVKNIYGRIYYSNDNGKIWQLISEAFPSTLYYDTPGNLSIYQNMLVGGGGNLDGLWVRPLYDFHTPNVDTKEEMVSKIKVTVFPNPATNQISIQFFTPVKTHSRIIISDSEGRIMRQKAINFPIYNGETVNFDLSGTPSGIYQMTVETENKEIFTTKFLIR